MGVQEPAQPKASSGGKALCNSAFAKQWAALRRRVNKSTCVEQQKQPHCAASAISIHNSAISTLQEVLLGRADNGSSAAAASSVTVHADSLRAASNRHDDAAHQLGGAVDPQELSRRVRFGEQPRREIDCLTTEVAPPPPNAAGLFKASAALMEEKVKKALTANLMRVLDLFNLMDTNRDGVVSRKEFTCGLIALGVCTHSLRTACDAVFDSWDTDGSGTLELSEMEVKLRKPSLSSGVSDRSGAQLTLCRPPPRPLLSTAVSGCSATSSHESGQESALRDELGAADGATSTQQQRRRRPHRHPHGQIRQQQVQNGLRAHLPAPAHHRRAPQLPSQSHRPPPRLSATAAIAKPAAFGAGTALKTGSVAISHSTALTASTGTDAAMDFPRRVQNPKNAWRTLSWKPRDPPPGRRLWQPPSEIPQMAGRALPHGIPAAASLGQWQAPSPEQQPRHRLAPSRPAPRREPVDTHVHCALPDTFSDPAPSRHPPSAGVCLQRHIEQLAQPVPPIAITYPSDLGSTPHQHVSNRP